MKIIIAGGRDFNNYDLLVKEVSHILTTSLVHIPLNEFEIVSGTASGTDKLGEKFSKDYKLKLKQFPADWTKHGKSAGYIRNKQMAEYADALIAFWNGESKGTQHMINSAREKGLIIYKISYKKE